MGRCMHSGPSVEKCTSKFPAIAHTSILYKYHKLTYYKKIVRGSRDGNAKSAETRVGWLVTNVTERPLLHLFDPGTSLQFGSLRTM